MSQGHPPHRPLVVRSIDRHRYPPHLAGADGDIRAANAMCPGCGPRRIPRVAPCVVRLRDLAGRRAGTPMLAVPDVRVWMDGEYVAKRLDRPRHRELSIRRVAKHEAHTVGSVVRSAGRLQPVVVDSQLQRGMVERVPVAPDEDQCTGDNYQHEDDLRHSARPRRSTTAPMRYAPNPSANVRSDSILIGLPRYCRMSPSPSMTARPRPVGTIRRRHKIFGSRALRRAHGRNSNPACEMIPSARPTIRTCTPNASGSTIAENSARR